MESNSKVARCLLLVLASLTVGSSLATESKSKLGFLGVGSSTIEGLAHLDAVAVIAACSSDLSWSDHMEIPRVIVDRCEKSSTYHLRGDEVALAYPNKGKEAGAFLQYISHFYGKLPKKTFFIHDRPFVHSPDILKLIHDRNILDKDVQPLNCRYRAGNDPLKYRLEPTGHGHCVDVFFLNRRTSEAFVPTDATWQKIKKDPYCTPWTDDSDMAWQRVYISDDPVRHTHEWKDFFNNMVPKECSFQQLWLQRHPNATCTSPHQVPAMQSAQFMVSKERIESIPRKCYDAYFTALNKQWVAKAGLSWVAEFSWMVIFGFEFAENSRWIPRDSPTWVSKRELHERDFLR